MSSQVSQEPTSGALDPVATRFHSAWWQATVAEPSGRGTGASLTQRASFRGWKHRV